MRSLSIALLLALALTGCQGATEEGDGASLDVTGGDTQFAATGAPKVTITSPESGLIVQSGDTLTLTATVFDDRDDSEALTLVVSSNLQGDVTYPEAKASGLVSADVVLTLGGDHEVTLLARDVQRREAFSVCLVHRRASLEEHPGALNLPLLARGIQRGSAAAIRRPDARADLEQPPHRLGLPETSGPGEQRVLPLGVVPRVELSRERRAARPPPGEEGVQPGQVAPSQVGEAGWEDGAVHVHT